MFFLYILQMFLQLVMYFCIPFLLLFAMMLLGFKIQSDLTKGKCKSKARLEGKVALITGGNSGIGLETARDLARRGARVIIASRNEHKSAAAVDDIIATTGNHLVEHRHLDLSKFTNVRAFAKEFNESVDRLDILVNNSGVAGLKNRLTEDDIDIVTQVNYFSPFLLTNLLLDKMIASKPSRIVIVSSRAHLHAKLDLEDMRSRAPKHWTTLYGNSKLYNVLWAKALARKLPTGVTANALHPGVVKTEIFEKLHPSLRKIALYLIGAIFKSAEEGAQTTIHLAVAEELENVSGKYFVDCKVAKESELANDEDLIEKVWQESLVITNSKSY